MARVPSHDGEKAIVMAPILENSIEHRFTIILRAKPNEPPVLEFQPSARGAQIGPRHCIAMCLEGIKWCLQQEIELESGNNGSGERKVDLWVPPGLVRPA